MRHQLGNLRVEIVPAEKAPDHWLDFTVHAIGHESKDDELWLSGYLKWDGCQAFETHRSVHFCGHGEIAKLFDFLEAERKKLPGAID